jgi:TATA-box binding protein (TBP) (component of TFIID and TFIIIB)
MSSLLNLDSDWDNFCNNDYSSTDLDQLDEIDDNDMNLCVDESKTPKCSDIYISTKTKIAYLSETINLKETFWKIPIMEYHIPQNGIIKKQMKFNSINEEDLIELNDNLKQEKYWDEHIITRIVNPEGRIKFKDIRKISVGICKKDILSYRTKKKSAFYNCFVVIMRLKHDNIFREIHVKVFNTGKLEIPGIQSDELLESVLDMLINTLRPIVSQTLTYIPSKNETVLINSNFNCGFFINREKLYEILKYKYHINSGYDPCSYPGIQCKFYYNVKTKDQTGQQPADESMKNHVKVSFMIFRTGSVLIVGKCNESLLNEIYLFIKKLLHDEHANICGITPIKNDVVLSKKKKIRKKFIIME